MACHIAVLKVILVLQLEVGHALHLARANLARFFMRRVDATKRNIPGYF